MSATRAFDERRKNATAVVGLTIFLGTLAMLFAGLFFAYGVMRAQAPAWPPPGLPALPRGALAANTLVLVGASLALRRARRAENARAWAFGALSLGAAFLVAQALVWRSLVLAGGGPSSGIYGSVFFAISGLHALHVVGGVVALAAVAAPRAPDARRLALCARYWDFVLVVWLIFFFVACVR
ncbi:MAG TPA: cytochrome c oxidase subunit 3 [Polyangia bacterium]|nr:cytochrome c oxidase subunit 3 [Polyangia bacterium]